MSKENQLLEALEESKQESPITPIGISIRSFSKEISNILQAQNNTIIKLLLKIFNKLEELDTRTEKLEINKIILDKPEAFKVIDIKDIL